MKHTISLSILLLLSSQIQHARPNSRQCQAYRIRVAAAKLRDLLQPKNNLAAQNNGDEKQVPDYATQFTKTLEHDAITGLVTAQGNQSYKQLLAALATGNQSDYNAIVRAPSATTKLANPQASIAFGMAGSDSSLFKLPIFPKINTPEAAALLIEDYLMVLARDVTFSDYGTGLNTDANGIGGSITNDAAAVLQDLGTAYTGPRNGVGVVDASVVFRGNLYGSLIGPYISQFELLPIKTVFPGGIGAQNLPQAVFVHNNQQYPIASGREFGVSFADFVAIQNGAIPKPYVVTDYDPVNKRYIINGRDLASYVHVDVTYEFFYNTAYIIAGLGFPLSTALPYVNGTITNEGPFITMGIADAFSMIGDVSIEALKATWAQKWRANRALRPDAFAGLVQNVKVTGQNPYDLNASLFVPHTGIDVLARILAKNTLQAGFPANSLTPLQAATYLLTQTYPEASPTHPTYPSGHAAIAGACITVIKAIYEDTTLLTIKFAPVKVNPANAQQLLPLVGEGENLMTIASELDKLAFNIGLGRDWAGIHYRNDALQGVLLGEQVAIKYLQDRALTYTEQTFKGYVLTKVDGTRVRITASRVTNA